MTLTVAVTRCQGRGVQEGHVGLSVVETSAVSCLFTVPLVEVM